jgi:hypothetical protein
MNPCGRRAMDNIDRPGMTEQVTLVRSGNERRYRYCHQMREMEIDRGGRVLRARDAGAPGGAVVMYFHGTPGSRLDLCFGEQLAAERGVRLVSFDRPGYGGSTPVPFGLASIAADGRPGNRFTQ